jgi:hypothetical protein
MFRVLLFIVVLAIPFAPIVLVRERIAVIRGLIYALLITLLFGAFACIVLMGRVILMNHTLVIIFGIVGGLAMIVGLGLYYGWMSFLLTRIANDYPKRAYQICLIIGIAVMFYVFFRHILF